MSDDVLYMVCFKEEALDTATSMSLDDYMEIYREIGG